MNRIRRPSLTNRFWKWAATKSLRKVMQKGQSTSNNGDMTSFTGWENILGESGMLKDYGTIWGEYSDDDSAKAYEEHAMVYACIRCIIESFQEGVLEVGYEEDGEWTPEALHPVLTLMEQPNPFMGTQEFFENHNSHKVSTGKGFIWKWRAVGRQVVELWPLPTHWVTVVPLKTIDPTKPSRVIAGYLVKIPGQDKSIPVLPEDMIFDKYVDPRTFKEGVGPMEACFRNYKIDRDKDDYIKEMLSSPVPGLILKKPETWEKEEKREIRAILNEAVGVGRRGKELFVGGEGATVEQIMPLKDLDWPGISGLSESHICSVFGVPPLLIHARIAQENTPLSSPNIEAAERIFYRRTMRWHWSSVAGSLTQSLLRTDQVSELLEFRFNTSKVLALQENLKELAEVVGSMAPLGILLKNEARGMLGLEPIPEFDGIAMSSMQSLDFDITDPNAGIEITPEEHEEGTQNEPE